jgi:hypothetical protein
MNKASYRIQASTEAEIARARLARAQQAADRGDREKAVDLAVESAFDAGIATTYSMLGGETQFGKETKSILAQAQDFVQTLSPESARGQNPSKSPKNAKSALALAQGEQALMPAIFYAGSAYGFAQAKKNAKLSRQAILVFDERCKQRPRATNPLPASKSNLMKRLLR